MAGVTEGIKGFQPQVIIGMAILRTDEMRDMDVSELRNQLNDLRKELVEERGQIEVGGFAENPGRIDEMRKTIARIHTVMNEREQ